MGDSGLLLKGVKERIQNEAKEQKRGFPSMLLGALGASLLGNILEDKGMNRAGDGVIKTGNGATTTKNNVKELQEVTKTKWIFNTTSYSN